MRDIQIYLTQVHADIPADADRGAFPLTLPFVEGLDICFKTPVTFIVGENGSGKSTLLEALVDLAGQLARARWRQERACRPWRGKRARAIPEVGLGATSRSRILLSRGV